MQAAQNPAPSTLLPPQPAQTPQAPQAPQATQAVITPGGNIQIRSSGNTPSASAIYEAFRNQRSELRGQLERLEEQREDLSRQLQALNSQPTASTVDAKGLEARIAGIDVRIAETEKRIAEADANVAASAAVPGAIVPPPPRPPDPGPPEEFWVVASIFIVVVGLPLAIAYARRIWRRGTGVITGLPQEIWDRFNKIDQAIDAVAIEVERVGEGQRYLTRVHAEQQRALSAGPAERLELAERERERQARK